MGLVVAEDGRGWASAVAARRVRRSKNEAILIWFSNVRQGRTYGAAPDETYTTNVWITPKNIQPGVG
jgi:hypothetical protein